MNKKSFFKKLLAIGVGAACVTTGALFAACSDKDKDKDKDKEPGPGPVAGHTHQWSTGNAWGSNDTHHWRLCLADGHGTQGGTDAEGYGAHIWSDANDTTCDTCGATRTVTPGGPQDPGGQDTEIIAVDVATIGNSIAAEAPIKAGLGITATSEMAIDASGKTITYRGEEVSTTKRIKPSGNGSASQKSLKVELDKNATIIVYGASGTSNKTAYLNLLDAEGNAITGMAQQVADGVNNNVARAAVFTVQANTVYYIVSDTNAGADSANAVINYIAVVYGTFTETKGELVAAATANCTADGNVAHYLTEYGRYLAADGTTVLKPSEVFTKASGHHYTYEASDVTVPTDGEGSVTLHCTNSGCVDATKTVPLPVLSSDAYTARPAEGVSGSYKITLEGTEVTFTAVGVAESSNWTDVYTNDFTSGTVSFIANIADATAGGLYWNSNDATVTEATSSYSVTVADNALNIHDAGNKTTNAFIRLDNPVAATGSVKISGTVKLGANNSSWTFLQLLNADNEEFIGLRTVSSGNIGIRIEGGSPTGSSGFTKATDFDFEIVINYTTNTVTVTIGEGIAMTATLGTSKDTKLTTVKFATADSATDRDITLSNITVSKQ